MTIYLIEQIAVASVAVTARALVETAGHELTFLGWRTLVVVGSGSEQMRLSEVAERLGLSRPSASKLVRRMVRKGLIELAPDPQDGRGVRLSLSSEGSRLQQAVVDRRRALIAESMSSDDSFAGAELDGDTLAVVASRLSRWI
jgi:DNA-binding MarR family transcriptional regulator